GLVDGLEVHDVVLLAVLRDVPTGAGDAHLFGHVAHGAVTHVQRSREREHVSGAYASVEPRAVARPPGTRHADDVPVRAADDAHHTQAVRAVEGSGLCVDLTGLLPAGVRALLDERILHRHL